MWSRGQKYTTKFLLLKQPLETFQYGMLLLLVNTHTYTYTHIETIITRWLTTSWNNYFFINSRRGNSFHRTFTQTYFYLAIYDPTNSSNAYLYIILIHMKFFFFFRNLIYIHMLYNKNRHNNNNKKATKMFEGRCVLCG